MDKPVSENSSPKQTETTVSGDVSKSVIISGDRNVVNLGSEKPPKRRQHKGKSQKVNWSSPAIIAAAIVAIATIIAALLNSPLAEKWAASSPTMTATALSTPIESATATEYPTATPIILVVTSTEVPVTPPTPTFTPTLENTATISPSPEPKADEMTVVLQSTVDEGKAPLNVNFNARSSYVKFSDGSLVACGNNHFCSYVFAIYRDGTLVKKISNNDGILSYTFGSKGKYWATVYVCRGEACQDDGVTVTVK